MERRFIGAIRVPCNLTVKPDAMNMAHAGHIDDIKIDLTLPKMLDQANEKNNRVVNPFSESDQWAIATGKSMWGYVSVYDSRTAEPLGIIVSMIAIKITLDIAANVAHYEAIRQVQCNFDSWFSNALEWISLWTGQIMEPPGIDQTQTQASVWEDEPGGTKHTGWNSMPHILLQTFDIAASRRVLESAFKRSDRFQRVPSEWLLYLRARDSRDNRVAVISAATAAEVALGRNLEERLFMFDESARKRITQSANGIVGVLRLLEDMDCIESKESRWKRVANRLAEPRNEAAHGGLNPSRDRTLQAIAEAKILLEKYSPLPSY